MVLINMCQEIFSLQKNSLFLISGYSFFLIFGWNLLSDLERVVHLFHAQQ